VLSKLSGLFHFGVSFCLGLCERPSRFFLAFALILLSFFGGLLAFFKDSAVLIQRWGVSDFWDLFFVSTFSGVVMGCLFFVLGCSWILYRVLWFFRGLSVRFDFAICFSMVFFVSLPFFLVIFVFDFLGFLQGLGIFLSSSFWVLVIVYSLCFLCFVFFVGLVRALIVRFFLNQGIRGFRLFWVFVVGLMLVLPFGYIWRVWADYSWVRPRVVSQAFYGGLPLAVSQPPFNPVVSYREGTLLPPTIFECVVEDLREESRQGALLGWGDLESVASFISVEPRFVGGETSWKEHWELYYGGRVRARVVLTFFGEGDFISWKVSEIRLQPPPLRGSDAFFVEG
jgi:hypothetical protein